jgi:hypothetical protein
MAFGFPPLSMGLFNDLHKFCRPQRDMVSKVVDVAKKILFGWFV